MPAVVTVSIGDNFYKPKDVTIQVGQSVKWKNNGAVAHTVTSDSDSTVKFDSGTLQPRGVYALKPGSRGKLTYFCSIHGKVQSGAITVNRSSPPLSGSGASPGGHGDPGRAVARDLAG